MLLEHSVHLPVMLSEIFAFVSLTLSSKVPCADLPSFPAQATLSVFMHNLPLKFLDSQMNAYLHCYPDHMVQKLFQRLALQTQAPGPTSATQSAGSSLRPLSSGLPFFRVSWVNGIFGRMKSNTNTDPASGLGTEQQDAAQNSWYD